MEQFFNRVEFVEFSRLLIYFTFLKLQHWNLRNKRSHMRTARNWSRLDPNPDLLKLLITCYFIQLAIIQKGIAPLHVRGQFSKESVNTFRCVIGCII